VDRDGLVLLGLGAAPAALPLILPTLKPLQGFFNRARNFNGLNALRLTDQSLEDVVANGTNAPRFGACGTLESALVRTSCGRVETDQVGIVI
jgi:hypothetical protein